LLGVIRRLELKLSSDIQPNVIPSQRHICKALLVTVTTLSFSVLQDLEVGYLA